MHGLIVTWIRCRIPRSPVPHRQSPTRACLNHKAGRAFRRLARTLRIARPISQKMASTGMKAADSGPASKAAPPDAGTSNNELCEHCSQALIINDQLAGGTLQVNASDGTTTLDLSGFKHNDWIELRRSGFRQQRSIFSDAKEMRDEHGWGNKSPVLSNQHRHIRQHLRFCAGNQLERRVTVPWMLEISASSFGPCRLCSRLRALFIEQYANSSWWNEHGSILRFTMQYEWSEYRSLYDGEDEPTIPPSQQSLDGLAVLVTCPGQAYNEVDVYQFDVVAWPGMSSFVELLIASGD